jgi:hypothetical protein
MWRRLLAILSADEGGIAGCSAAARNLSSEQLAAYRRSGSFGSSVEILLNGTEFCSNMMNIAEFDAHGQRVWTWCICPEGNLVRGDNMLAQKLALELFETEALAKANKHPPSRLASFNPVTRRGLP